MKKLIVSPRLIAALFAGLLAPAISTHAIPNSIGGVGFINPAGMRFEDFAARKITWEPNADLKAKWEMWHDETLKDTSVELMKLSMPALIFGLPADEVVAYRKESRVEKFVVTFRPGKGEKLDKLDRTLRRNLDAWADSGSDAVFQNDAARIQVTTSADVNAVIVTFSPTTPAAAS